MTQQTITITLEQYEAFDNAFAALEREVRKLRRELKALLPPQPEPTPDPEPEADDLGAQAATLFPELLADYRSPTERPIPISSTRFDDDTLTVIVDTKYLEWLNRYRFSLQKMLCQRLTRPVNLAFEAHDPQPTAEDPPPSRSNGQEPGESAETGQPEEKPQPEPEPAEVAGEVPAQSGGGIITGNDGKKYSLEPRPANRQGEIVTDDAEMAKRAAARQAESHAIEGKGDSKTRLNAKADSERNPVLFLTAPSGAEGAS